MNRREAEELLPWHVAGTLSVEESMVVQAFIDSGEISATEVDSLATFAEVVAAPSPAEPAYNPAILKRALEQLDDVVQEAPAEPLVVSEAMASRPAASETEPGLLQKLLAMLQWSATPVLARVVVAGQFALLLGFAVLFGGQIGDSSGGAETVGGSNVGQPADFSLIFSANAREAEIRALLLAHGATIVAGPSSIGIYQIAIPGDADPGPIAEGLTASPLITFLQPVPRP